MVYATAVQRVAMAVSSAANKVDTKAGWTVDCLAPTSVE